MELKSEKNEIIHKLSYPFDFKMCVEMPQFLDEYKFCFNKSIIDNSLIIKSKILPIIMMLEKVDYLFLMKVLYSTITYDDLLDKIFIHDYKPPFKNENSAPPSTFN